VSNTISLSDDVRVV